MREIIRVAGYDPIGDQPMADTTICITGSPPWAGSQDLGPDWERRHADWFNDQATAIVDALIDSLPQGTTDRVLGLLLLRKASLFVIRQEERKPNG